MKNFDLRFYLRDLTFDIWLYFEPSWLFKLFKVTRPQQLKKWHCLLSFGLTHFQKEPTKHVFRRMCSFTIKLCDVIQQKRQKQIPGQKHFELNLVWNSNTLQMWSEAKIEVKLICWLTNLNDWSVYNFLNNIYLNCNTYYV